MDNNDCRNRVLHGLAQELELPKLTFQVIRRTIATLAQKKGMVKDIQGVLRHFRIATTTNVYMQEIPESLQETVDAIRPSFDSFLIWKGHARDERFATKCYQTQKWGICK